MNGEQCRYESVEDSQYCATHDKNAKRRRERVYNVTKWKARIGQHANHNQVYNLREDLGVLRILLETQLEACNNELELMTRAPAISDLVMRIERLVPKAAKLEEHFRSLLDVNAVNNFADAVIDAVISEIDNFDLEPAQRDAILDRLADKIEDAMPKPEDIDA